MFSPIYSPITYLMINGIVPRGFINDLFNRTAPEPELFEKVSTYTLAGIETYLVHSTATSFYTATLL